MEGGITSLIILHTIHTHDNAWGYMIKQECEKIMKHTKLSDSTLYTTLRNLENNYALVTSTMNERRREYNLSKTGRAVIDDIYDYWIRFTISSLDYIKELKIASKKELWERIK